MCQMMMANHNMKAISSASEILDWLKSHTPSVLGKPARTRATHGGNSASITIQPAFFNRKQNSIINNASQAYTVTNDL